MNPDMIEMQRALLARHGITGAAADQVMELSFAPASIHIDRALTNLAVSIRNREMIADDVCPVVQVQKPSDKYFVYDVDTMYEEQAVALTGAEAMPGRVRYKISTSNFSVTDYGLMDFVSNKEMESADAPIDPQAHAVRVVTQRLDIAKERRVAALVFASGNYGANTEPLAGPDRWDQTTSDPAQKIDDAIEACDVRPNVMVIGAQAWQKLKNHPKLKELILGRAMIGGKGSPVRVTLELAAQAFELDAIYVGRAKYNTNREGAASARGYIWGKSCALIRVTDAPSPRETDTFAYQFRQGMRETQVIEAPLPGVRGGQYVKVTESLDEKVVGGANAGYLLTTVVS
jgi:hypothetical protein